MCIENDGNETVIGASHEMVVKNEEKGRSDPISGTPGPLEARFSFYKSAAGNSIDLAPGDGSHRIPGICDRTMLKPWGSFRASS